ncbi:5-carboxymethyl-2-hydroxymuconate Delta-isomerase [Pseudoalteromonas sp. T1lg65]|uniref:5-carboxymethyl-2-hydroxymuconate Delta-isomerase n=1 Tax=Pseudoalteromonas sp. T1lg65 TaxID=2077101 RepID=UPI003F7A979A
MPHFILEYSPNLPIEASQLVSAVHEFAQQQTLFQPKTVKTRAVEFQSFALGCDRNGFVHLQIHLMAGRSETQKKQLCEQALVLLQQLVGKDFSITVHCYDLLPSIYCKN